MKLIIDTDQNTLAIEQGSQRQQLDLYTKNAFELLSRQWVKLGWNQKYSYTFTWLGSPIIQLPEDMLRLQEVIFQLKPDVIIETGVAHGGSLIFYSSLCHALGKGRVIGVDIEIRPNNRKAIESHLLNSYITLIEGDSVSNQVISTIREKIRPSESVMVILDSNHTYEHVLAELNVYANIVSLNSYLVVTDGIMNDLYDVPRGNASWNVNNPVNAAKTFLENRSDFILEEPKWLFNESDLDANITYYPSGWLKRIC